MNLLQLLVLLKRIKKFPIICDFFVVTLIFFQYYNNLVNCSRFQANSWTFITIIELNDESPYLHFSLNSNGIVTGWGYTKEGRELSEVLKELIIPYIPFRKCFEKVPNKFKRYITFDKICGGYLNNAQDDLTPPEIIPKGEDYIINATQTFTLRCSGKNFVTWSAPDNDYSSEEPLPKYSNITVKSLYTPDSEYSYESVLTISNASYLDVGYYYCHENTTDFNDSSRVSRIYIYVYDAKILSLNPESVPYAITVVENSDAVLPCKPTSPDVKVELRYTTGDEIPLDIKDEFGNCVTYDPKKGYTISKVTLDDNSNLYNCIFSRLDDEQYCLIVLYVKRL